MQNLKDKVFWTDKILPFIMEYGIYLLAIFLFTDKGESFRSLGLYIPPIALVIRAYLAKEWPFDWKDPFSLLVVAFCLSGVLSSIFAPNMSASIRWFNKTHLKLFLIFIVISYAFKDLLLLRRLTLLFALLSVFFTGMTFYDYVTKAILPNGTVEYGPLARKYTLPMLFLVSFVPLAVISFDKKIIKGFWVLVLLSGILAMLLAGSRSGWVSMSISLTLWVVLSYYLTKNRIAIIALIFGIVIGIVTLLHIIPSHNFLELFFKQGSGAMTERFEMTWKASIENYRDFPFSKKIIGKGLDKETMYKDFDKWYKNKHGYYPGTEVVRNPHNFYLYLLYKQGILGLSIYLVLIFIFIKKIYSALMLENTIFRKAIGIALLSAFIGSYVIHGLVDDLRFMPLGLLVGIAGAYLNSSTENKK